MSFGKKCPNCGFINDEFASCCRKCQESLFGVSPEHFEEAKCEEKVEEPSQTQVFKEKTPKIICKDNQAFSFCVKDGDILGREGTINVSNLPDAQYISRQHAVFRLFEGRWYLEVLSKTNPTRINNELVPPGARKAINNGDEITIAKTVFIFKLE
jgi:pSer/pThr/pTyr-binding forkhead associated (FHA) protein